MLAKDSFSPASTTVQITTPPSVTGIERIMLSARGDLQRLLSSFLSRPINIKLIYAHTNPSPLPTPPSAHVSPLFPIVQDRQVHLLSSGKIVCIATSNVTITAPDCGKLFLEEGYAIGQVFQRLRRTPVFTLVEIKEGERGKDGKGGLLERTYIIETEGFVCKINEVFPDRELFVLGEKWLDLESPVQERKEPEPAKDVPPNDFFTHTPFSPSTISPLPFTLSSILRTQATNIPDAPFSAYPVDGPNGLVYKEVSYAQFYHEVKTLAKGLREQLHGVLMDKRTVGVLHESGYKLAVIFMALLELNVTAFLLSPANSEAAVAHLLNECDAPVLVHSTNFSEVADRTECTPVLVANEYPAQEGEVKPLFDDPPETPVIVHSSGSTAFPKPVRWSQTSFLANSQIMLTRTTPTWSAFQRPGTRFLCLGPLVHTLGLTIGMGGAICGGNTIVFPLTRSWPPSPTDVIMSMEKTKITTAVIVPLLLEQVADTKGGIQRLKELDLVITGGAHCPTTLAHSLVSSGINLKNIYGSSETGHLMIGDHIKPAAGDLESWALVKPFPHTEVKFVPVQPTEGEKAKEMYQVHVPKTDARLAAGVLKDGEESWNTGDVVEHVREGWYRLLFRDDDILVHVSGEKTNPIPIETAARSSRLIERIAVVGHQRPITAAIVQLRPEAAQELNEAERRREVLKAIDEACSKAPSHSRVLEEMVFILPIGGKTVPVTAKGNPIRPRVLSLFKDELDALYADFAGLSPSVSRSPTPSDSTLITMSEIEAQVTTVFLNTISKEDKLSPKDLDSNASLFDLGLDSVTSLRLRKNLSKAFSVSLPAQFVYQHFSLSKLVQGITTLLSPALASFPSDDKTSRASTLKSLIQKQLNIIKAAAPSILASRLLSRTPRQSSGEIVALVGASGSLGAHQLLELLDNPDVEQIVCLLRGSSASSCFSKLRSALPELSSELDNWEHEQSQGKESRVKVQPFELGNPLEPAVFAELAGRITTVIQTGWKMDFNRVVGDFEDCVEGTTHLLLLTAFLRPSRFFFISSIGVVLSSPPESSPVPETLLEWSPQDPIVVSPHGYSESKFVAEQVILQAAKMLDIPTSVARVGQISGDSKEGRWKVQEMNVLIIKGSARIGKFPVPEDPHSKLDWAPVDLVARTTIELALRPSDMGTTEIWHIAHPYPLSYPTLLSYLSSAGLPMSPSNPAEWWDEIKKDDGNPCLAIESYIGEAVVGEHNHGITLALDKTIDAAKRSLGSVQGEVSQNVWQRYVKYWKDVGFLP